MKRMLRFFMKFDWPWPALIVLMLFANSSICAAQPAAFDVFTGTLNIPSVYTGNGCVGLSLRLTGHDNGQFTYVLDQSDIQAATCAGEPPTTCCHNMTAIICSCTWWMCGAFGFGRKFTILS